MKDEMLGQQNTVEELIASYRALEDFVHMVSHDLQSPLKKIASFAGLARLSAGDSIPEKTAHYLDRIETSAKKAAELVAGLLEFSKKSAGTMPPEMTDTNDVLRDVLSELELRIEESGARIHVTPLPAIFARRTQIYYLFVNLIENAINYRSTRPLEIKIAASQENGDWIFSVKDNGIGIEPGEWTTIFQLFRRLEHVHGLPGNGIGLSICKKIVEKHGGRIWVNSKFGAGSTFYFSLSAINLKLE